jgi:hypothetical protein
MVAKVARTITGDKQSQTKKEGKKWVVKAGNYCFPIKNKVSIGHVTDF